MNAVCIRPSPPASTVTRHSTPQPSTRSNTKMLYSPRLVWLCVLVSVRAAVQPSPASICQSKVNRHGNACYWLSIRDTFDKSQQRCAASGGNLATIANLGTSKFIKDFLKATGTTAILWIGYDERQQTWEDGTPFSWSNYRVGEGRPNREYCTGLLPVQSNYGWVDLTCERRETSLCQLRVTPSRQTELVGVEAGSSVTVGGRVGLVQSDSVIRCARQCARDADCSVLRYTQTDHTCSMYTRGGVRKHVDNPAEWFLIKAEAPHG